MFQWCVWVFLFEVFTCTCIQEMLFLYFKAVSSLNKVVPKFLKLVGFLNKKSSYIWRRKNIFSWRVWSIVFEALPCTCIQEILWVFRKWALSKKLNPKLLSSVYYGFLTEKQNETKKLKHISMINFHEIIDFMFLNFWFGYT